MIAVAALLCTAPQVLAGPAAILSTFIEGPPTVIGASGHKYEVIARSIDTWPLRENEKFYVVYYRAENLDDITKLRAQAEDLLGILQTEATSANIGSLVISATMRTSMGVGYFDKGWRVLYTREKDGVWRSRN